MVQCYMFDERSLIIKIGYSFAVVAVGKKYAIVQNDGSNLRRRTQPIGNGLTIGLSDNPEFGDVSGAKEYANALVILRSIEQPQLQSPFLVDEYSANENKKTWQHNKTGLHVTC